jgi:membrane-anchored glycerophosphoryl diester phosphodiesterase (GDPDase)
MKETLQATLANVFAFLFYETQKMSITPTLSIIGLITILLLFTLLYYKIKYRKLKNAINNVWGNKKTKKIKLSFMIPFVIAGIYGILLYTAIHYWRI